MAQTGGYREELENESKHTDPNSHASRLIAQEIERLNKGEDEVPPPKKGNSIHCIEIHHERPQKFQLKIRLPVKEYPRYNFMGKLLGPKGQTLKALQTQTGCKMAIMGKGSMRDKDKEEELRKEGGKYAHLDEDLHVLIECYEEMVEAYHRIGAAAEELKKFIIPQPQDEMYDGGEGALNGAAGRGRGGFRGVPPAERGGRGGSFRGGRGAGPPPHPPPPARGGRGGPPARGAPRGAGRGAPPPLRGGGRGAAPNNSSYDGYGSQGYGSGGYDSGYDGYGGQNYSSGSESQYYDYGHASSQGSGYDSYSGYDYGDNWSSGGGKATAPPGRGGVSRGPSRSHPYQRSSAGGGGGY